MSTALAPGTERSGRYAFLRSPRWIGLIVTSILAACACVWLGSWQLGRHEEKVDRRTAIEEAAASAPVPAEELVGDLMVDGADVWRQVTVTGHFADGTQLALRNRPVDGVAALHAVDLFVTELGGRTVLLPVDRGWIVSTPATTPADLPAPPDGDVTLTLRLRAAEHFSDRDPAPGWIYSIDEDSIRHALGNLTDPGADARELAEGRGVVVAGFGEPVPGTAGTGLNDLPEPETSIGNHLSYAFQWWIFAAGALAIVPLLARREADEEDEALLAGTPYARGGELSTKAVRRASDADEEDAWLDAAR
jgi:cytochrome oxidase assembly protein ShyY1